MPPPRELFRNAVSFCIHPPPECSNGRFTTVPRGLSPPISKAIFPCRGRRLRMDVRKRKMPENTRFYGVRPRLFCKIVKKRSQGATPEHCTLRLPNFARCDTTTSHPAKPALRTLQSLDIAPCEVSTSHLATSACRTLRLKNPTFGHKIMLKRPRTMPII